MKKIAVLTSGGDAPGMNSAVRSVVRTCIANDIEVYGIEEGYYGLYHDKIRKLESVDVANTINRGGTFLGSARFPEFAEAEIREEAVKNLDKRGIEGLVIIGGDGSFMGAKRLTEMGYPCVGLPGTIDNDTPSSDFTIGFDTALNTIVEAVDRLRDTSGSHQRCSVVEVMGRDAGDLALWAGIATGAEATLIPEIDHDIDEIISKLQRDKENGKRHFIVIVAEGLKVTEELTKRIEDSTGIETRATVLGHIQRGGVPTAFDRVLAARMGSYAVELLMEGEQGRCIGIEKNALTHDDIIAALDRPHTVDEEMYRLANRYLNV
ncbi:6-phosphofructokinase [Mollicutes bacterium LVI A0078]|nr:6-phosphofructokinase [Mollicutes bacterium LVI A0075]WOO91877.1 6-phosphofructokinase [Mollicutes bacterium LVI A0078]